jgi:hypothetical protein
MRDTAQMRLREHHIMFYTLTREKYLLVFPKKANHSQGWDAKLKGPQPIDRGQPVTEERKSLCAYP